MNTDNNINEKIAHTIATLSKEVYKSEKDEVLNLIKSFVTHDVASDVSTLYSGEKEILIETSLKDVEESLYYISSLEKNPFVSSYESIDTPEDLIGDEEIEVKREIFEKGEMGEAEGVDMLILDVRDVAYRMAKSDQEGGGSIDVYSLLLEGITMGMMKGRGEYVCPTVKKKEREKDLRESVPSDDQLAQDWGYEDWDDFSSTI